MPLACLSGRYLGGNLCQRYYIIHLHVTLTAGRQRVYTANSCITYKKAPCDYLAEPVQAERV